MFGISPVRLPVLPLFGAGQRCMPRALYHVTTEANWKKIKKEGVLHQGEGLGWDERQGVFALELFNWLRVQSLVYLSFLIGRLRGEREKLVLLRIAMTPAMQEKTRVALIAPAETETGQAILEKASEGAFSEINSSDDIVFLTSYNQPMIRNTFPLDEFTRAIPATSDPMEYIIGEDVPVAQVKKVAEIAKKDIPKRLRRSADAMRVKTAKMKAGTLTEEERNKSGRRVPDRDKQVFINRLLASRHRLKESNSKAL